MKTAIAGQRGISSLAKLLLCLLATAFFAACGGGGEGGGGGGVVGGTHDTPVTAAAAPSGFSANPGNGQVTLTWAAVSGATSYNLYRSTISGAGKSGIRIAGVSSGYADTGLTNGTVYYYVVTTVSAGGESVASSQVSATPQSVSSTRFTGNFLAWTNSSDTSHYFVLVRVSGQTGAVTTIGGSNFFTGLAYGPEGKLYGVSSGLHIINPATGSTTKIGDFTYQGGTPILMTEAAFAPDGRLFVLENSGDRVFAANLTTGALTLIGTTASTVLASGLEFSSTGTLYTSFASLFTLNPTNMSTASTVGSTGGVYITKLTLGNAGNMYGMDTYDSTHIYTVNLGTGLATALTSVGSIGLASLVAEQTQTTQAAALRQATSLDRIADQPGNIEALLEMEGQIRARLKARMSR